MDDPNLLRKQVLSEVRRQKLIFLTVILLSLIYFITTLLFGDMGLIKYFELKKTKTNLEKEISEIEKENQQINSEIKLLKEDPFYTEKHVREQFGLAKPDEYIFQYEDR
ncbi:MAG: septum formation initiator family protein [Nitrospirota bacterium]